MRLPTPSTRRLDGVEGDVYGFDKAWFCWGSLISWEFLVCYCDASYLLLWLLRPGYGCIYCEEVRGQHCYAVRSSADTCIFSLQYQQKPACQPLHSASTQQ